MSLMYDRRTFLVRLGQVGALSVVGLPASAPLKRHRGATFAVETPDVDFLVVWALAKLGDTYVGLGVDGKNGGPGLFELVVEDGSIRGFGDVLVQGGDVAFNSVVGSSVGTFLAGAAHVEVGRFESDNRVELYGPEVEAIPEGVPTDVEVVSVRVEQARVTLLTSAPTALPIPQLPWARSDGLVVDADGSTVTVLVGGSAAIDAKYMGSMAVWDSEDGGRTWTSQLLAVDLGEAYTPHMVRVAEGCFVAVTDQYGAARLFSRPNGQKAWTASDSKSVHVASLVAQDERAVSLLSIDSRDVLTSRAWTLGSSPGAETPVDTASHVEAVLAVKGSTGEVFLAFEDGETSRITIPASREE